MLFSEFWLKKWLIRGLDEIWYKEATPIQEQVMKIALSGKNIVGQSQTWTGKTAAFLLPVLDKIDTNNKDLQALILAPTRELVTQIWDEIRNLTKYYGVTHVCLYGGASPNVQMKNLKKKPAIIVSTTGRLMDFMGQGLVNLNTVNYFILDEVDMMLDMGFVRDIKKIRATLKRVKQTYTFSATMNNDMKTIIKQHVPSYEFIKIGDAVTVDKINHRYVSVEHEHKLTNIIKLISSHSKDKIIIFTHTKRNTKTIHKILVEANINAWLLNWNMWQGKRQWTLNEFKVGKLQVLVTTDVAARWLNMENVWLVINFDVPVDAKSYIHRIGRTGRAGAHGKAVMLVSSLEKPLVKDIEKMHRINIEQSDHITVQDKNGEYWKIRLNRSTDKLWWKRLQWWAWAKRWWRGGSYEPKGFSKGYRWNSSKTEEGGFKKETKRRYSKASSGDENSTGRDNNYRWRREDGGSRTKSTWFDNTKSRKRYDDWSRPSGRDGDRNRSWARNSSRSESGDRNSRTKPKSTGRRLWRKR